MQPFLWPKEGSNAVQWCWNVMGQFYEIVSIKPAGPPPGATGSDWHCYVIALDGSESVCGYRQGSIKSVTMEVEEIVAQVNERNYKKSKRDT